MYCLGLGIMDQTYIVTPKALNTIQSHENFCCSIGLYWLESYTDLIQESDRIARIENKIKKVTQKHF